MKSIFIAVLLLVVGISNKSFAEDFAVIDTSNQQNMAAIVRIGIYDSNYKNVNGNGIEAVFRYKPLFFLATEAGAGYFRASRDGISGGDSAISVIPITAAVKGIIPFYGGNVYAGVGGGIYPRNIKGSGDEISGGINFGAGAELFLTKSEMILFDYKRMVIAKNGSGIDIGGNMFNLGFGYRF